MSLWLGSRAQGTIRRSSGVVTRLPFAYWTNSQPSWLTEDFFLEKIQPQLAALPNLAIARQLTVSIGYAAEVKRGRVPHPRHWLALAELLGF